MVDFSKFHPALAVSNIKSFILIVLDLESAQYSSWSALFLNHAKAFAVLDHLLPPSTSASSSDSTIVPSPVLPVASDSTPTAPTNAADTPSPDDPAAPPHASSPAPPPASESAAASARRSTAGGVSPDLWSRLDAIVLQWVYGTISNNVLHTIIEPDATAFSAWTRLAELFQDNRNTRSVHLEQQFSTISLDDYTNVSTYCQKLKQISDQLANVGSSVSNSRLVLQLVSGLTEAYGGVATLIQQSDPLPNFTKARSMLVLEEVGLAKRAARSATALIARSASSPVDALPDAADSAAQAPPRTGTNKGGGRGGKGGGRGKGRGQGGRSGTNAAATGNGRGTPRPPMPWVAAWSYPTWGPPPATPMWSTPPAPYPTMPWRSPVSAPGVLGARPQAHYVSTYPQYMATDVEQAMHTMSLQQPDDNWYLDSGASSHMTSSASKLSAFSNLSSFPSILVGNGNSLPVEGRGNYHFPAPYPPFILKHALYAPGLSDGASPSQM